MQPTASPFRVSCKKVASFRPRSTFQSILPHLGRYQNRLWHREFRAASGELAHRRPRLRTTLLRSRKGSLARSNEPEQERCHLAHLYLLAALRNAVAPMVPVDVFEGILAVLA